MKHLRFTGTIETILIDVTYCTDLISSNAQNFTVSQIQVGSSYHPNDNKDVAAAKMKFKELAYNLATFKSFATSKGLTLTMSDSNGANKVTLVA